MTAFAIVSLSPAYGKASAISELHYYSSPHSTSIIVELDTLVKPRVENLQNPPRIVIDLPDTHIHLPGKATRTFSVNDGLVRQVRVAQNTLKTARIVVDLVHEAKVTITPHKRPVRLNIDVRFKAPRSKEVPEEEEPEAAPPATRSTAPAARPAAPAVKPATPRPDAGSIPAATVPQERVAPSSLPSATASVASSAGDKLDKFVAHPAPGAAEAASQSETPAPKPVSSPALAGPKPLPATADANGKRSLTRVLGLKLGRVVIDAGHGGHDEGTRGPGGLLEKDLVLDVALRLGALVEQRLGAEVVYTRSTDVFVPLEERTAIANRAEADLFLSIHANSSPLKSISGSEVYYLSFATSKEAMDLAARENASTNKPIHELQDLLKKIALNEKVTESQDFASRVQSELYVAWKRMSGTSKNRGVKKAPFVVLIGAHMPSVLAEVGFVTNPHDEALLKKGEQRQRLAEALYRGVNAYASTLSRMEEPKPTRRAARDRHAENAN